MKKTAEFRWFVVHLAIADCFYAVVCPIQIIYLLATNAKWNIGKELCKILTVSGPLSVNVSAWILCLMGYERYRAICHPFASRFSKRMIHVSVGITWIACIGIKIFTFIRTSVINEQCFSYFNDGIEQTINAGVSLLAESIIPIILLSYYLVRVTITMRKRSQLFEAKNDNCICLRKNYTCSSNSFILAQKYSEKKEDNFSTNDEKYSRNLLQVSSCSNNNLIKKEGKSYNEIELKELSINVPQLSKKTTKLWNCLWSKHSTFKLVIPPRSRKNSSNKADRFNQAAHIVGLAISS
ncbi:type-1 angiotensin II receptor B isoform X2 [Hydra vulgaris]|uniref:Type-1 angiotensin II receptor B isoform X2 n=1 Tax=Hydra vulgaris TaxID=6087 RepID=A0ABM4B9X1_HYDVU